MSIDTLSNFIVPFDTNKMQTPENQAEKSIRLKQVRTQLRLNQAEMAEILGIERANLSKIEKADGKRNVPKDTIYRLKKHCNINEIWFETGEGEMFLPEEKGDDSNAKYIAPINYPIEHGDQKAIPLGNGKYMMIVPLVQEFAYAGYLAGWKDPEYIDELPKHTLIVDQQPHSEYKSFEVIGDSMRNPDNIEESILDGSIATGRFLDRHHWTSKFHTHRWKDFVIVHKNGILIKRIKSHNVLTGDVVLESLNPDKVTYPDKQINLNDVFQIFNIINVSKAR